MFIAVSGDPQTNVQMGDSNCWTGIWNGTVKWKMERNGECTLLQLTCVTDAAQSRLNISSIAILPYRLY